LVRIREGTGGGEPRAAKDLDEMAEQFAKAIGLPEVDVRAAIAKALDRKWKKGSSKPPLINVLIELGVDGIEFRGDLVRYQKEVGSLQFGPSGATNRVDLSGRYLSSFAPSKQSVWGSLGPEGEHIPTRLSQAKIDELVAKDVDILSNDGAAITTDPRPNGEIYYHLYDAETGRNVDTFKSLEEAQRAWENAKAELSRFNGTETLREGGINFKREVGIIEPEVPMEGNPHLVQRSGQLWDIVIDGKVVEKGVRGKTQATSKLAAKIDPSSKKEAMTLDEMLAYGTDKRSVSFPPEVRRQIAKQADKAPRETLPDSVLRVDVESIDEFDELVQAWATFNAAENVPSLIDLPLAERQELITSLLFDVYNRDVIRDGGTPFGLFIAEEGFDGIHVEGQGTIKLEKKDIDFLKRERANNTDLTNTSRSEAEEIKQYSEKLPDNHGPVSNPEKVAEFDEALEEARPYQDFGPSDDELKKMELQDMSREVELELEEALLDLREATGDDDLNFEDFMDGESDIFRIMQEAQERGAQMEQVQVAMDKYISCLRRG
jgi:hypothetical protein